VTFSGQTLSCGEALQSLAAFGVQDCQHAMIPDVIVQQCPVTCETCTGCTDSTVCTSTTAAPTKPPTNPGDTLKTTYSQTFLGDKTKCGDYKDDIKAANVEALGVEDGKVTVTEGAGCEGVVRRRLATDSLTFGVSVEGEVEVDVSAVQTSVTNSLAATQPDLSMVSMTEAAVEVDESNNTGAANTEDSSSSGSLTLVIIIVVVIVALCCCVGGGAVLMMMSKDDEKGGAPTPAMDDEDFGEIEDENKRQPGDTAQNMHDNM